VAIVKASYTRLLSDAKRYVRYIAHRPAGRPGRVARDLWNGEGKVDRATAYELLDRHPEGRGTSYFRFAVSPDPRAEDTFKDLDVRKLAARTMRELEDRLGRPVEWVAALHDDHAAHRHAHVMAVVHGVVRSDDLRALAAEATAAADDQRRVLDRTRSVDRHVGGRDQTERTRERIEPVVEGQVPAGSDVQP
jgi:hypothetical protein